MFDQFSTELPISEPLEMTTVVNSCLPGGGNIVKENIAIWILTDSTRERLDLFEKEDRNSGVWSWYIESFSEILTVFTFPDDCQHFFFKFWHICFFELKAFLVPSIHSSPVLVLLKLDSLHLIWSDTRWHNGLFIQTDNRQTGNRTKDLFELVKMHCFADVPNYFCLEYPTFYRGCEILALLCKNMMNRELFPKPSDIVGSTT